MMSSSDISRYNIQYVSKLIIDKSGLKRKIRVYVLCTVMSILANIISMYFCDLLWVKIVNVVVLIFIFSLFLRARKRLLDIDSELKCITEKR